MKIGFIGLGIMGRPMALNLIKAGHQLGVYSRRKESCQAIIDAGAQYFATPKDLAPHVEVIITMLPAPADVEDVLLGKNGVINTVKPGTIVIDMSTISVVATERFAERLAKKEVAMLDAPVSGGEQGAIDGTLTIMVGGDAQVLEKVQPIFDVLGGRTTHIGKLGAGQTAKACNQIIIAETIVAVSEALSLAKASGVDPEKVREALMGGYASSRVLEVHGERMLKDTYAPGFKAALHRKDMHLAVDQAQHVGINIPAATYAMQCLDRLVLKGHGQLDSSAIHLLVED